MPTTLTVNGTEHTLDVEPDMPLLWALRETLGLTGTKFGCGISACGACTVHLNGRAVRSCTLPISAADGQQVTTIEGLAPNGALHKVQQAWIAHQVPQCGYCQSGMIMAVAGAPRAEPPSDRRRDRRGAHEHLPLRHVRPRAARPSTTRPPQAKEWRREQVDQARLHRRRHRRRRRLPARRRRLHVRAGPAHAGVGRRGRAKGSSRPGSRSRPDNIVTILIPHCEMGQGTPDGARDDGGRGAGRRLVAGARAGSAGARRLRQRLHRPRGRRQLRAGGARARRRLRRLSSSPSGSASR